MNFRIAKIVMIFAQQFGYVTISCYSNLEDFKAKMVIPFENEHKLL